MRAYLLCALAGMLALYCAFDYGCRYTENRIAADTQTRIAADNKYASGLQQKLDVALHHVQIQTVTLKERIPYAVTKVVYQDRVVDRPVYYFTRADILCWNSSLGLSDASACPDPKTAPAESFALTGTSLTDAFSNLNDNGATCQIYRTVALGWQEWWAKVSGQHQAGVVTGLP